MALFFHIEERRAWMRTSTHTTVFDRDPEFERFRGDPTGTIKRLMRIWLAEPGADRWIPRAYLGCVGFCASGPSRCEVARLLRHTLACAEMAGQPGRVLCHRLLTLLRQRLSG